MSGPASGTRPAAQDGASEPPPGDPDLRPDADSRQDATREDADQPVVVAGCRRCAGLVLPGDRYCEQCGTRLDAAARSGTHALRASDARQRDLGLAAGATDRGLVHRANEDGMGLGLLPDGRGAVGVVCDGVSSAPGSGPAAAGAARAATELLTTRAEQWRTGPGLAEEVTTTLRDAARAAQTAAVAGAAELGLTPACTFVAAVAVGDTLVVGWLGDSRAYLVDAAGTRRLTEDDTVAAEAVRAGQLPPELAEQGRAAHTITRWLGSACPSPVPRTRVVRLRPPSRVVLCSDGLWNYASAAAALAAHIAEPGADATPITVARHLVDVALRAGGADNVTVIVIDIPESA
ncbi:PP2C family protein-serine/threonine phosphatase [Parafrankia sp. FMc2]|uniref:PP2C family protein-serine/threonine phosphatase n=1 Tax=Parafrankia sp. FMc2 TaxID=3233196 RepID=UPI0034D3AD8C